MSPSMLQPVLFGALFMGVLSALPVISFANCCCLWVIGGGMVTAYLLQRGQQAPIELGQGALGGFLAGVLGAVIASVLSELIDLVSGPLQEGMMETLRDGMLNSGADVPPEVLEMFDTFGSSGFLLIFIGFIFMLLAGMVFSTLGGLVGAAIFRKSAPAGPGVPPPPANDDNESAPAGSGVPPPPPANDDNLFA